jgi:hypothetical protein
MPFLRPRDIGVGRLIGSMLLALLLLCTQRGALVHELSHFSPPAATERVAKQAVPADACELCLAFAQVGSGAARAPLSLPLLGSLEFERTATVPVHAATATPATPRSRGPPIALR